MPQGQEEQLHLSGMRQIKESFCSCCFGTDIALQNIDKMVRNLMIGSDPGIDLGGFPIRDRHPVCQQWLEPPAALGTKTTAQLVSVLAADQGHIKVQPGHGPITEQNIQQGSLTGELYGHVIALTSNHPLVLEIIEQGIEQRERMHHIFDEPFNRALGVGQVHADNETDAAELSQITGLDPGFESLRSLQKGEWITDIDAGRG